MKPGITGTVHASNLSGHATDRSGIVDLDVRVACHKKNIFDMICGPYAPTHLSNATVKTIADQYAASGERSGWLWLCTGLPPQNQDPINWMPSAAEYDYLNTMLDFLYALRLSTDEMHDMSEFPLRRAVDRLLMSGAFCGCGSDLIGRWASDSGYEALLGLRNQEGMTTPRLVRARAFIGRVANHFEHMGAARLKLLIGAALSYYGGDTQISLAQQRFLKWTMSQKLYPLLLDLAIHDFLIPESGVLQPNIAKIKEASGTDRLQYTSVFGQVDLAEAVTVLDKCLLKSQKPETHYAVQLLQAYLQWHIRWMVPRKVC